MSNNNQPVDIHGKSYHRAAMIAIILIGSFGGMLMQTSLGTALPTLMHDFNINMSTAQQATSWFLLANGIMVPVSAYLTTKFSTRLLYYVAFGTLLVGLSVSAFAPTDSWTIFLGGRIIQAIAVGVTMPLMQVVMLNVFGPEQRGKAMGLGGLVIGMSPAVGPTLTGWILEKNHTIFGLVLNDSWRSIFVLPMIIVGAVFLLSFVFIKDVIPNRDMKLDWISLATSIAGFGSFLWGFTNVAQHGWSDMGMVILPIVLGSLIIAYFIYRQTTLEDPFMNVKVFKIRQFSLTTAAIALSMMAMMGVEMMLPLYLQEVHGMSALDSGLSLLPGALMMGVISPIAGAAYDKVGAKRLAYVGFLILGLGTIPFMFLTVSTPEHYITVLYGLRMAGIAMVMMPLTASAMSALPREEAPHGTASNNTARQIAAAVVVALLSSVTQNIINSNKPAIALKTEDPIAYAQHMITASLDGFHASFAIGFSFALIGLILARFLRAGKIIAPSTSIDDSAKMQNTKAVHMATTIDDSEQQIAVNQEEK